MIGEQIHSYEINAHLGQGGMGNVFRATDNMLGREVALKMLHPQLTMQPQFLERFKKEARILAQLLHPNIAVIYNFIEHGGNHFMVMEYVEGTSLDDLLKKYKTLPASFVVPVFIQALEGLQHAHKKNILHRDIKPSNLMITQDATLKLMDFGIAKVAGEQKMTQVNKIVGTIEFMAPELIEGKDASPLSDIYAMGATLYELISGKIPFEGDTDFNLMQAILKSRVKPPEKFNPQVPKALSDIVVKAMDRNPELRFPNARAFQQALISAFPGYREIDWNLLKTLQAAGYTQAIQPGAPTAMADSMETRVGLSKALTGVQLYKEKILSNKKQSLLILGLLLLVISALSIAVIRNGKELTAGTVTGDSTVVKPTLADPVKLADANSTGGTLPEQTVIAPPQKDSRLPVVTEPVAENNNLQATEDKQDKKLVPVKQKKETPAKVVTPVSQPVEKVKQPEEVKPAPPKDVYLGSSVSVSLSLSGMPDMNQEKKRPQNVSFSVSRPVYYGGVLIIRQGARASGMLTIGRVRTDIEITSVEAVNGNRISIRADPEHGRRDDIRSGATFMAVVPQGTRINF